MTKEEIIKPENLVYKKPTLMNDNPTMPKTEYRRCLCPVSARKIAYCFYG